MIEFIPMPLLGAAMKLSMEVIILSGIAILLLVSMFTFANWRAGVKIACVMVLAEGAIRKWVPGAQELAYFVKDIFLVGAYMRFYFSPTPELRSWRLRVPMGALVLLCAITSFSAINPNIGSIILALYGLKIYFFYIPLAFMIPYLFRSRQELENNMFWYAMLATPICLLGVAQSALPTDSFLNMNAAGEGGTHMGWEGTKTRVTGTFSYITGHVTFVTVFFAIHLALLLNKQPKWRWIMLLFNTALLFGNALMAGSRSAVATQLFIGMLFAVLSVFNRLGNAGNAFLIIAAFASVVALGVMVFFADAGAQWLARFNGSTDTIHYRTVGMATGSVNYAIQQGGFYGYGIGMTHPALERMRGLLKIPRPRKVPPTYDTELGQVLVELGVIGWICWYMVRLILFWLCIRCFMQMEPGVLKSLCLASISVQMPHMIMSVVLNHTANFLIFAGIGLCLLPLLTPTVTRRFVPGSAPQPRSPTTAPAGQRIRG